LLMLESGGADRHLQCIRIADPPAKPSVTRYDALETFRCRVKVPLGLVTDNLLSPQSRLITGIAASRLCADFVAEIRCRLFGQ
jgi:hypothetical protein